MLRQRCPRIDLKTLVLLQRMWVYLQGNLCVSSKYALSGPTPSLEIHLKYQSYQFGCWLQMETSKFACLIYLVAGGNAVDDTFGARETGGLHCIAILDGRPKWWYVDRRSHILQPMSSDFVLFDNT